MGGQHGEDKPRRNDQKAMLLENPFSSKLETSMQNLEMISL